MPYTPTIAPTTELEAVNAMLASGGEAPVSTLVGQRPDVVTAQALLKDVSREVQSEKWTFNTEFGVELLPAGTLTWTNAWTSEVVTLNVFTPPAGLLSFKTTAAEIQVGGLYTDTVIRPSKTYGGGGTLVFYDRATNRDGWERSALYIDPVWLFDYEKLPQSARTYIALMATRRYLERVVGTTAQTPAINEDLMRAERILRDEFGEVDDYNIFRNHAVTSFRGGRAPTPSVVYDRRWSPSDGT